MDYVAERRWKLRNDSAVPSGRFSIWTVNQTLRVRLISGLSLPGRTRAGGAHIPNDAGAVGCGAHARGWAMTEIRFEPAHSALKFFEQLRNQATKMAKLCSFVALLFNHSALETALFRYSFWGGRLGGARASRLRVRASRPNHRWTN